MAARPRSGSLSLLFPGSLFSSGNGLSTTGMPLFPLNLRVMGCGARIVPMANTNICLNYTSKYRRLEGCGKRCYGRKAVRGVLIYGCLLAISKASKPDE